MSHLSQTYITFLFSLTVYTLCQGQKSEFSFESFSTKDGLPNLTINDITQDQDGYLWIATNAGLARYDGYSFEVYRHHPNDTTSITDGFLAEVFVDSHNEVWVGTSTGDGLYRMDESRERFRRYLPQPDQPGNLKNGIITSIIEDEKGKIWLSTQAGIQLFDRETAQFSPFLIDTVQPENPVNQLGGKLEKDSKGRIWIGTQEGLWCYYPTTGVRRQFRQEPDNLSSLSHNQIEAILEDKQGMIWVGTIEGGLNELDPHTGRVTRYLADPSRPDQLSAPFPNESMAKFGYRVVSIYEDRLGRIWIGSIGGNGLVCYDRKRDQVIRLEPDKNRATAIQRDVVSSIFESKEGVLWFGFWGNLSKLIPAPEPLEVVWDMPGVQVNQISEEATGVLWAGTNRGLFCRTSTTSNFTTVNLHESSPPVTALHIDKMGGIWVGTSTCRLFYRPSQEQSFQEIAWRKGSPAGKPEIAQLARDGYGQVWLRTLDGGLWRLNAPHEKIEPVFLPDQYPLEFYDVLNRLDTMNRSLARFQIANGDVPWKSGGKSSSFQLTKETQVLIIGMKTLDVQNRLLPLSLKSRASNSDLWSLRLTNSRQDGSSLFLHRVRADLLTLKPGHYHLGRGDMNGGWFRPPAYPDRFGIQVYDVTDMEKSIRPLLEVQDNNSSLHGLYVVDLTVDPKGNLFVATNENYFEYRQELNAFQILDPTAYPVPPQPFFHHKIISDGDWVYTYGGLSGGQFRMVNKESALTKVIDLRKNSPYPFIFPMAWSKDVQNRFWIAGDRQQLMMIDPKIDQVRHFYPLKIPFPVILGSSGYGRDSTVYFGGNGGLIAFQPKRLLNQMPPTVNIEEIKVAGEVFPPMLWEEMTGKSGIVHLNHQENDLTIRFKGIHFIRTEEQQYAYQLFPVEKDWRQVGSQRQAIYPNLPPGKYTFRIKAANSDGVWSEEATTLNLIIHPPWYWNRWSRLLYLLIGGGIILGVYRFQLHRRLAIAEAERLRELDEFKSKLYTNITHEFRTPLTVILAASAERTNAFGTPKDAFGLIRSNGQKLLDLVNQLLDLSKAETGALSLNLVQGDIIPFLSYLTESFTSLAIEKNISLSFYADLESLIMDYDPDKIQQVLGNLLSNAIKFTLQYGKVMVIVKAEGNPSSLAALADKRKNLFQPSKSKKGNLLDIQVRDTGIGIPESELPFIFDRFHQVDGSHTRKGDGTGIGLALTKELVKLMDGEITVKSAEGKGSTFSVHLPIRQEAAGGTEEIPGSVKRSEDRAAVRMISSSWEPNGLNPKESETPLLLIIEDNRDVVRYLVSSLETDYRIEIAYNGREGIDKAIETVPDIVISDVMMPEKDGYEVCQTLKTDERTSHIPIILLTAKADAKSRLEGLETGADAYLAKPFSKEELEIRLRKLIELRRQLQERYSAKHILSDLSTGAQHEDAFLRRVREAILSNIADEQFGVSELARATHLSRVQLYRKLKALTGETPTLLIRKIRLQQADQLLRTTDLTVGEIAYQVGFKDHAYFSRVYKEEFGQSPSHTRE